MANIKKENINCDKLNFSISQADEVIEKVLKFTNKINKEREKLLQEKESLLELIHQMEVLKGIDLDIEKLLSLKFIKFRFGKMPKESFKKLDNYIKGNLDAIFIPTVLEQDFIWGIYFMPRSKEEKVDAIFTSLNFERSAIPENVLGVPSEVQKENMLKVNRIEAQINKNNHDLLKFYEENKVNIISSLDVIQREHKIFDVRKHAIYTKDDFYIISGWMAKKDVKSIISKLDEDNDVIYTLDDKDARESTPPTKIKNLFLFRPFEMFVKMYGLPSYNEIDPTLFLGLTYAILFGMMFGDVGHGLTLLIGGFLFYRFKKSDLGAILALCGGTSTIFGFFYGSVFGFEGNPIQHMWLSPMERKGTMTLLLTAIGIGAILILLAMIFNIINSIKAKRIAKCLFDTNGVAGFIFYFCVIWAISPLVANIFGKELLGIPTISKPVLVTLISISLVLIFLREPLENIIDKKKKPFPNGIGEFLLESFFKLFEILLSFITNSISFVRVGGFALSHAGMMMVVHLLAGTQRGNPNIITLIIGNIFVMGLEGLIVGIQVLRLEYYEMFSRFYEGRGREFKPYKIK